MADRDSSDEPFRARDARAFAQRRTRIPTASPRVVRGSVDRRDEGAEGDGSADLGTIHDRKL
jgi:hypothetical protein